MNRESRPERLGVAMRALRGVQAPPGPAPTANSTISMPSSRKLGVSAFVGPDKQNRGRMGHGLSSKDTA